MQDRCLWPEAAMFQQGGPEDTHHLLPKNPTALPGYVIYHDGGRDRDGKKPLLVLIWRISWDPAR
jgi:hypothetical protein